jgi:hypothetical protein
MGDALKIKEENEDIPKWGKFWRLEFEKQKFRTGMLQNEKLSDADRDELIGLLTEECKRQVYYMIPKDIMQRVISDAVVNDPEFKGFNVAWVRRSINTWWHLAGYKLMAKEQREDPDKKIQLTPQQNEQVNYMLNSFVQRLKSGKDEENDGAVHIQELEEIADMLGKANDYFTIRKLKARLKGRMQKRLDRASTTFYEKIGYKEMKQWDHEETGLYVLAETQEHAKQIIDTQQDAIEIYRRATT